MKNLKKFTKAELISKLSKINPKKSDSSIENKVNNQSIWARIIELLLIIKKTLWQITLIVTVIKIFKKYRFFRALWMALNSVVMTIFGISLLDNFRIDFISKFLNEIRFVTASIVEYFTNTYFYSVIAGLFTSKEIATNQKIRVRPVTEEISWQTKGTKGDFEENKGNSKISEWLKPDSVKKQEEMMDDSYNKYYLFLLLLLLAGVAWYYSDQIKDFGTGTDPNISVLDRIKDIPSNLYKIPGKIKNWWSRNTPDNDSNISYSAQDKIKAEKMRDIIDTADLNNPANNFPLYKNENLSQETIKLEDRTQIAGPSLPLVPAETGLREISWETWDQAALGLPNEIDQYFKYANESGFPKAVIQVGLGKVIADRIKKLSWVNPEKYEKLMQDPSMKNKFENFNRYVDSLENENVIDSAEVWSDGSPSPILSPVRQEQSIEQILSPGMTNYAIDDPQISDYRRAMSPVEEEALIANEEFKQWATTVTQRKSQEQLILETETAAPVKIHKVNPVEVIDEETTPTAGPSRLSQIVETEPRLDDSELLNTVKSFFNDEDEIENQTESSYNPPKRKSSRTLMGMTPDERSEIKQSYKSEFNTKLNESTNELEDIQELSETQRSILKTNKQMATQSSLEGILHSQLEANKTDTDNPSFLDRVKDNILNPGKIFMNKNTEPSGSSSSQLVEDSHNLDENIRFSAKEKGKGREIIDDSQIDLSHPVVYDQEIKTEDKVESPQTDDSPNTEDSLEVKGEETNLLFVEQDDRKDITKDNSPLLSTLGLNTPIYKSPLQTIKNIFSSTSNQLEDMENLFSDEETNPEVGSSSKVTIEEAIPNLTKEEKIKIQKISEETDMYRSDLVIEELTKIIPNYSEASYRESFIKAMDEEIKSAKTENERNEIIEQIRKMDMNEIYSISGSSDTNKIKNAIRENYTHNLLLREIKNKASSSTLKE